MELIRVAANTDGVSLAPFTNVSGFILVAGSDAATASIFDAATQTGTAKIVLKSPAADQRQVDLNGVQSFRTGLSVTLTGTGPILYILKE